MRRISADTVLDLSARFGVGLKTAFDLAYGGVLGSRITAIPPGAQLNPDDLNFAVKELYNGTTILERLPQEIRSGLAAGSIALCAAELVCNGCPPTESESRPLYDTSGLEGEGLMQETLVEKWARDNGYWIEYPEKELSFRSELTDAGTESVVYFCPPSQAVYKTITLKYYNVLRPALDRIVIHNALFPDSAMTVIGFGRLEGGEFAVIVRQPYIVGIKPSEEQRCEHMHRLGFKDAGMDYGMHLNYISDTLYVGDVNEYNALLTSGGVSVIDADCRILREGLLL